MKTDGKKLNVFRENVMGARGKSRETITPGFLLAKSRVFGKLWKTVEAREKAPATHPLRSTGVCVWPLFISTILSRRGAHAQIASK